MNQAGLCKIHSKVDMEAHELHLVALGGKLAQCMELGGAMGGRCNWSAVYRAWRRGKVALW